MQTRGMPNKDGGKGAPSALANDPLNAPITTGAGRPLDKMGKSVGVKNTSAKVSWKGVEMMGNGASPESPTEELLGSVTSGGGEGAVRTSARVIKKMKLDSAPTPTSETAPASQQRKDSIREGDKPDDVSKLAGDKQSAKIGKCRTPKALWSSTEKDLFFEALNEYGKDFDSITSYICNKMKRKGVPDSSTKAKHQVSTFYYRTWQKVSKYVKFDDNVKKVVQELYALINYGELRKRMEGGISSSKLGGRLGELVKRGVVAVRWRGRTLRVRTPVCRALRTLNQLHEWEEQLRLPVRVVVQLCARDSEAWHVVQGVAHNPRVLAPAPPSLRLHLLLHLLHRRWTMPLTKDIIPDLHEKNSFSCFNSLDCQISLLLNPSNQTVLRLESHEQINSGVVCPADRTQETNNKDEGCEDSGRNNNNITNCLNGNDVHNVEDPSQRTAKQSGDTTASDNRLGSQQQEVNVSHKDKLYLHVGPKPGLSFSLPTVSVGEHLTSQRICFNSYQERLRNNSLFSGLQNGTGFKGGGRLKNQKRSRKDSGDIDGIRESKKGKGESDNCDIKPDLFDIDETANDGMDIMEFKMIDDDEKEKDFLSEIEDDAECEGENKQKDQVEEVKPNIKSKVPERSKKENHKSTQPGPAVTDGPEEGRGTAVTTPAQPAVANHNTNNGLKSWNKDVLLQQIKKGWSVTDAGDLTIGDLYLMFGSESKLELEYWWCEPSAPMQQRIKHSVTAEVPAAEVSSVVEASSVKTEADKECGDNEKDAVDALLMSPTHASQDSNDTEKEIMSPDHRQNHIPEEGNAFPLVSKIINCPWTGTHNSPPGHADSRSPEQRDSSTPLVVPNRDRIVSISSRLKKLLSIAKLYDAKGTKTGCSCGHFCGTSRLKFRNLQIGRDESSMRPTMEYPWQRGSLSSAQEGIHFRTPLPKIAVKPSPVRITTDLGLEKLPPWTKRGGRPRVSTVTPQKFNIVPRPIIHSVTSLARVPAPAPAPIQIHIPISTAVKGLPKLRPKPCVVTVRPSLTVDRTVAPTNATNPVDVKPDVAPLDAEPSVSTNSNNNNQATDGEPKSQYLESSKPAENVSKWPAAVKQEMVDMTPSLANLLDISLPSNICDDNSIGISLKPADDKHDNFTGLLTAESMSMSPSRLLKENDHQWFEADVHNFSLSSFLGHLEGPHGTNSSVSKLGKPDEESTTVDTPLNCLMNDSIDYMAKFEDLAKRASAEPTK